MVFVFKFLTNLDLFKTSNKKRKRKKKQHLNLPVKKKIILLSYQFNPKA